MCEYNQMGEKIEYSISADILGAGEIVGLYVELLTGDYTGAAGAIADALEFADYDSEKCPGAGAAIWAHIKEYWNLEPMPRFYNGDIVATIERVQIEPEFSHSGCDWCNDGLGAAIYPCIEYADAAKINQGEYRDIELCGDCLCSYHNGD